VSGTEAGGSGRWPRGLAAGAPTGPPSVEKEHPGEGGTTAGALGKTTETGPGKRSLQILVLLLLFFAHLLGHLLTDPTAHRVHDFLFKSTYLQIILAALWFGLRGGLLMSVATSLAYIVHIQFQLRHHGVHETLPFFLEVLLYNVVALLAGLLIQRERRVQRALEEAKGRLETSLAELRHKTEALFRAEEQLRRADRLNALGIMAAGMAHELRNPLSGIRGAAEILQKETTPPEKRREFARILIREADRLDRVISSFLEFARPPKPQGGPAELRLVLSRIRGLLEPVSKRQGIRMEGNAFDDPVALAVDPEILQQILLNLILNAIQAMPGGGTLRVESRMARPETDRVEGMVEVRVTDTGHGIPEAARERIFEPFFTTKEGGTGLGLSIVARLLSHMGGEIALESTGPEGTTFRVRLPRC
jgi:signal transduction histidine kinase